MKKKILLIGGSSKLGQTLIEKLNKNEYEIYSTFNKNKISLKNKKIKQFKIDLINLNERDYFLPNKNFDYIFFLSGLLGGKSLHDNNLDNINSSIQVNLTSQILLLKKILKFQKKNCLLIFISSIAGRKGSYDPVYAAAKSGIITFARSLSIWLAPKIKSIVVCPGIIKNTKMYKTFSKKMLSKKKNQIPNKEFLNLSDLSDIIIDLMKPHWKHANGSIIDINGGLY